MNIVISKDKLELGQRAAEVGSNFIQEAIAAKGAANIIVATGASQFEMLSELVQRDVEWSSVHGFHLDEYIDITAEHPASFRKYLKERFVDIVKPQSFHYVNGEEDPSAECDRLHDLIVQHPIDVAFVGIGENGHLAFNDPPADFATKRAFLIVDLDLACRTQQLNEGWFSNLNEVPKQAISMSINQIMASKHIVCTVPDQRKAQAVLDTILGPITPEVPASILQQHPSAYLFLDQNSSSLIPPTR